MDGRRPPRWSELQVDLLELILEKLDLDDHARFASVCPSWRSVAVGNPPINKPLYTVLSHSPQPLVRRFISSFVPNWETARFLGAGLDGWLVILIDGRDLFLLNKGSNSKISLPLPTSQYPLGRAKVVLSSPPPSGECTVVIKRSFAGVFYFRLGSDKSSFTKLSAIPDAAAHDVLFFNQQLYVLCNFGITVFDRLLNKASQLNYTPTFHVPYDSRLLILGNQILAVSRSRGTNGHLIFTFEGSNPARVVQLSNIGDNLLLLDNRHCTLSISTKEHKEFRRTNYYEKNFGTYVLLDTGKDPNKAKFEDPWPLFFLMFNKFGIDFKSKP